MRAHTAVLKPKLTPLDELFLASALPYVFERGEGEQSERERERERNDRKSERRSEWEKERERERERERGKEGGKREMKSSM